jgi:hypothetical protein
MYNKKILAIAYPAYCLGCDFVRFGTNTRIRERTLWNIFFKTVSSVFFLPSLCFFWRPCARIQRYTDAPSHSFFILLILACPPLIYFRSPLAPQVHQPQEEFRSYPGDTGDTTVKSGNPLWSWIPALQWLLVPVLGGRGASLKSLFPPLAIVLLEGQSRLRLRGFMLQGDLPFLTPAVLRLQPAPPVVMRLLPAPPVMLHSAPPIMPPSQSQLQLLGPLI